MTTGKDDLKTKQPYHKPRLRIIELVADEVLAVGCKLKGQGTGPANPCVSVLGACSEQGS